MFKIYNREISDKKPCLIIAEIGINHNGSLKIAKKMVDAAIKSGAEVIKHQTHIPDDEMTIEAKKIIPMNSNKSIYDIMSQCSLSEQDESSLKKYTEKKGAIFLSTPFSRKAVDRLNKFNVKAFKIGSGECNNYPLIDYISYFKKPIILSTGMNSFKEIDQTVEIIKKNKCKFAILHTTNLYPTDYSEVRLNAMLQIKDRYPNIPFGLSDHTTDNLSAYFAISMGAQIVEKHFTDTKKRSGPDIVCSMNPKDLTNIKKAALAFRKMFPGDKKIIDREKKTAKFAFGSIIASRDIVKGEKLSRENLWAKRPGTGDFLATDYFNLIGRKSKKSLKKNKQLQKKDIY